jgi:hypothetical protein
MNSLTAVISSTGILDNAENHNAPVDMGCPRISLGLACLKDQYVCLCESSYLTHVGLDRSDEGAPVSLLVVLKLAEPGNEGAQAVVLGLHLTGYVATLSASRSEVRARFMLNKPINMHLREFVASGI